MTEPKPQHDLEAQMNVYHLIADEIARALALDIDNKINNGEHNGQNNPSTKDR